MARFAPPHYCFHDGKDLTVLCGDNKLIYKDCPLADEREEDFQRRIAAARLAGFAECRERAARKVLALIEVWGGPAATAKLYDLEANIRALEPHARGEKGAEA